MAENQQPLIQEAQRGSLCKRVYVVSNLICVLIISCVLSVLAFYRGSYWVNVKKEDRVNVDWREMHIVGFLYITVFIGFAYLTKKMFAFIGDYVDYAFPQTSS